MNVLLVACVEYITYASAERKEKSVHYKDVEMAIGSDAKYEGAHLGDTQPLEIPS